MGYQFQEFPKWVFSIIEGKRRVVANAEEERRHTARAAPPVSPRVVVETLGEKLQLSDNTEK